MGETQELKFVGRGDEIKRLNSFVFDKVAGGILLLVGREGMGKSRLVKQYYNNLGHSSRSKVGKLLFKVAEHWSPEVYFTNLLVEVSKGKFLWGSRKEWADLVGNIPEVGPFLKMLLSPKTVEPAPDKFFKVLKSVARGLGEGERLVVFLDPDKYLKPESLSVFRYFRDSIPNSVKFIIPQRPEDVLFSDAEFCSNQAVDILELQEIAENDRDELYHEAMPSKVFEKGLGDEVKRLCGGWPIFVEDMGKLLRRADDVETEFKEIDAQQLDLLGAQSRLFKPLLDPQYAKERWTVYGMSILSGSQDRSLLGDYLSMEPDEVGDFLTSQVMSDAIKVTEGVGEKKYQLYHQTFNEYVQKRIGDEKDVDLGKLHKEAAAAFYKRIEKDRNDAEALTEFTHHLRESGDQQAFMEGLDNVHGDKERIGLYRQLRDELTEALSYKVMAGDSPRKAWFLSMQGIVNQKLAEPDEALKSYEQAREVFRRLGDESGVAAQESNIGITLADKGDVDAALKCFEKDLSISESIGDKRGSVRACCNIGNLLAQLGDLEGALKKYTHTLKKPAAIGDASGVAATYNNMAVSLRRKGDLDGAAEYANAALGMYVIIGDPYGVAAASLNIANISFHRQDYRLSALLDIEALLLFAAIGAKAEFDKTKGKLALSITVLRQRGEFQDFLQEAKEQFGEEVEKLLGGLFTADEADETDSASA